VDISPLASKARELLLKLKQTEAEQTATAVGLVESFIIDIESEPNVAGLNKAAHSLSWRLVDQLDPLPLSIEICGLSSHARHLAKS